MNALNDVGRDPPTLAADRLSEIETLFEMIRKALQQAVAEIGEPTAEMPKAIKKRLDDLIEAHLKILSAEDAFHAKIEKIEDGEAVDYDAIRAEIGRQLDRIRESLGAEGVFVRPDR
jgi:phosphoenolpyruvate-protein kinase (PTS system EI component)